MSDSLEPTEDYDGAILVRLLDDSEGEERHQCSSYEEAIGIVKKNVDSVAAAKIVSRDGQVVFTSMEMDIEDWEKEWKHAKRSLSVDVEEHDCPYDSVGCVADDLCVQCKMDKVQNSY